MNIDYREKIKKLLALSKSRNEHEARSALLKARELMAEYKLTEEDLEDVKEPAVKRVITEITCSKRKNPWIVHLSAVISENYCCKLFLSRASGKQTSTIGFIGLKDDAEICTAVFDYAVDCVLSEIRYIKLKNSQYPNRYVKRLCDSYGYGFANGLHSAFKMQKAENEQRWGLIMAVPRAVEDAVKNMNRTRFKASVEDHLYQDGFSNGYRDGKAFDPAKRLAGV